MTTHPFPSVLGKTLVGKPPHPTTLGNLPEKSQFCSRAWGGREWVREAQVTEGREEMKQVALKCRARGTEDFGSK